MARDGLTTEFDLTKIYNPLESYPQIGVDVRFVDNLRLSTKVEIPFAGWVWNYPQWGGVSFEFLDDGETWVFEAEDAELEREDQHKLVIRLRTRLAGLQKRYRCYRKGPSPQELWRKAAGLWPGTLEESK